MCDNCFFEYASFILTAAGHMTTSSSMYINHSANETLYVDSKKEVVISDTDRNILSFIDNISLLTEVEWTGSVDEEVEKIQIFSATVNFSELSRSQDVADIHRLLQRFWDNNHSIVIFKNKKHFIFSFADDTKSHILSDWFEITNDCEDIIERISIENISLHTCNEYFEDLIYAIAREYYIHPISFEEASYEMMPVDLIYSKNILDDSLFSYEEIVKEKIKTVIRTNLSYYEDMYGSDYVLARYEGIDDGLRYLNITEEIERISFELDFEDEYSEERSGIFDFDDEDDYIDDDFIFFDDFYDDYDPAIFNDPVLMIKWLENRQKQLESQEEHCLSVLDQSGGKLIPEEICNPGQVYTVARGNSGMLGVFRLESKVLPGNGRFEKIGLGSDREAIESVTTAYNFLKANCKSISRFIDITNKDYIINYQDLQGIGITSTLSVSTLVALCSITLGKPVLPSLAILGEISISGSLIKANDLANLLQVCYDSGVKKVLIPIPSAVDLTLVPPELLSNLHIIIYSSALDAVFKSLGVE